MPRLGVTRCLAAAALSVLACAPGPRRPAAPAGAHDGPAHPALDIAPPDRHSPLPSSSRRAPSPRSRPPHAALEGDGFGRAELAAADLAMLALEQQIAGEINRLRRDPAGYARPLGELHGMYRDRVLAVPGHLALMTREGPAGVDEAIRAVRATGPAPPLRLSAGLSAAARAHARDLSRSSKLSHVGRDGSRPHDRMLRHGSVEGLFAENIGAIYTDADLMVMELVVDDGVPSRIHRYHLLAPMFRALGVGCAGHRTYRVVCVMTFAERFRD